MVVKVDNSVFFVTFVVTVGTSVLGDAVGVDLFGDAVHPDILDIWEFSRIMTARISWSPYMFNRRLPPLLNIITVPTLVIFGNNDTVIPYTVGQQFIDNLSNGQLEIIDGGGHLVEWEMPDKICALIVKHSH